MIKDLIRKIKFILLSRKKSNAISRAINNLTDEQWNQVTSGYILDSFSRGEKQYVTLTKFVESHERTYEFFVSIESIEGVSYKDLLMRSKRLTKDQKDLLNLCKIRKINSELVLILETIDEYEHTNNFSDYHDDLDWDDNLWETSESPRT